MQYVSAILVNAFWWVHWLAHWSCSGGSSPKNLEVLCCWTGWPLLTLV